ncbi:Thymidylate kinase [Candidatus Bealeia paramacronuclearis]|uniref:Thymidylate kinase n=1 Tax=Candidatus Bealeia paramacronuclearis TaxID=1921001 RepID=A0ABZ2C2S8_9PROT|nr:Thymidylate kinase [Candidatus Bealeia paramacronuclearis]
MKRAPFITFEGGEGTGKSTQIRRLQEALLIQQIQVETFREPGGTTGAEAIRKLLVEGDPDRWDGMTEALLMYAARRDLTQKRIIPTLAKGIWGLCDRFFDSTMAYQGFGHELGYETVRELNHAVMGDFVPDLTFVFNLGSGIGLQRAANRGGIEDRFERKGLTFHERVDEGYAEIVKRNPERCVVIDAFQDIHQVFYDIAQVIEKRFGVKIPC